MSEGLIGFVVGIVLGIGWGIQWGFLKQRDVYREWLAWARERGLVAPESVGPR